MRTLAEFGLTEVERTELLRWIMRRSFWRGQCLEFGISNGNHGQINIRNKASMLAHRVVYELVVGPIPDGLRVLHECDNPPCINVWGLRYMNAFQRPHLYLGTAKDNSLDMVHRGRAGVVRGERQGQSRLTEPEVLRMRELHAGGMSMRQVAAVFHEYSESTCVDAICGRTWKFLPMSSRERRSHQGNSTAA